MAELDYRSMQFKNNFYCKEDDIDCNDSLYSDNDLDKESVIAFKVYGSCRHRKCLSGPAKTAKSISVVVSSPHEAAAVDIDNLKIKKIIIIKKKPNKFKKGFWNIYIKYFFEYGLTFRKADGCIIGSVKAGNIYKQKVELYGSVFRKYKIGTDLLKLSRCNNYTFNADPFILIKAKAVKLEAGLRSQRQPSSAPEDSVIKPNDIIVSIGLFTVITLYRIKNLLIKSEGTRVSSKCDKTP